MMLTRHSVYMLTTILIHKTQGYHGEVSVVNIWTGYSTVLPGERRYLGLLLKYGINNYLLVHVHVRLSE